MTIANSTAGPSIPQVMQGVAGDLHSKPLVSFIVFSYNSGPFLEEAVGGAFAQDYSPMEIILSDDASADHSYEIMCRMADAYVGPHRVILNRNEINLGIGAHVNKAVTLASGEWVVLAAGDDISMPNRTRRLMASVDQDTYSIYSNLTITNEAGEVGGFFVKGNGDYSKSYLEAIRKQGVFLIGASHAFRKSQYAVFGNIDPLVVREDEVIGFRSLLLGHIKYIDDPLVLYRRHGQNISDPMRRRRDKLKVERQRELASEMAKVETWLHSLKYASDREIVDRKEAESAYLTLKSFRDNELEYRRKILNRPLPMIINFIMSGGSDPSPRFFLRNLAWCWLPHKVHVRLLRLLGRIRFQS